MRNFPPRTTRFFAFTALYLAVVSMSLAVANPTTAQEYVFVDSGEMLFAGGTISDPFRVAGTLQADGSGALTLSTGLDVLDGGVVDLGTGRLYIENLTSGLANGTIDSQNMYLGLNAPALFTQTAGVNTVQDTVQIGLDSGAPGGVYQLVDGQLRTSALSIGHSYSDSANLFVQQGGTVWLNPDINTNPQGTLWVAARASTGSSSYEMYGGALSVGRLYFEGNATFIQDSADSTVNVFQNLELRGPDASTGVAATYDLRDGFLQAQNLYLSAGFGGSSGSTEFLQTAGQVDIAGQTLVGSYGRKGTYRMDGGTLNTTLLQMGEMDRGPFTQGFFEHYGGSVNTDLLVIAQNGRYDFHGGELSFSNLEAKGLFDFQSASHNLNWDNKLISFADASILNAQNTSLVIGSNSILLLPASFDPSVFAAFNNQAVTSIGDETLVIGAGRTLLDLQGTIDRDVQAYGQLTAKQGAALNINGSVEVFLGSQVNLQNGTIYVGSGETFAIYGGELTSGDVTLRSAGQQSAGQADVRVLLLGSGSPGFTLSGGVLETVNTDIDYGAFRQSGGLHDVGLNLMITTLDSNGGGYHMQGGDLRVLNISMGTNTSRPAGSFHQTGGDVEAAQLVVRPRSFYTLDAGTLLVNTVFVGSVGSTGGAVMTINGGKLELGGPRSINPKGMWLGGSRFSGTLTVNGGQVISEQSAVYVGNSGSGYLYLNNGLIDVPQLFVGGDRSGLVEQTGGRLVVDRLQINALGRYVMSGGLLDINDNGITVQPGGEFVFAGGRINGSSTIDLGTTFVQSGGTLAPGNSPGLMSINGGYALASGTLQIELDGATGAGFDYDQLRVIGVVDLLGDDALANADLQVLLGYAAQIGDSFTILDNDETDAVLGTFAQGLSISADFEDMTYVFAIDYAGGTGNDITLTVDSIVPEPTSLGLLAMSGLAMLGRRRRAA